MHHDLVAAPLRRRIVLLLALALAVTHLGTPTTAEASPPGGTSGVDSQTATPAPEPATSTDTTGDRVSAAEIAELDADAGRDGSVRVLVTFRTKFTADAALSDAARGEQRRRFAASRSGLLDELAGSDFEVNHTYETVPVIALTLSRGALRRLTTSAHAASVQEDMADAADLLESSPLVGATEAWSLKMSGTGHAVAVLDTGTDKLHPFVKGKVVSEACYSGNGNCPDGSTASIALGSGVQCTYAVSGCRHGTHVAGIAAGKSTAFSGVARDSRIISVQVFSRFTGGNCAGAGEDPCTLSYFSDQIAGLERVYALRSTYKIGAVNMSLGGGFFTSACDGDSRKPIIDNLRAAGIPTVVASGNNGFSNAIGAPACISSAIAVGSTTKADGVSSFSNSSAQIALLAPGSAITSSVPGGGFASFFGTSMAAPHVAGAFTLMRQRKPTSTVTQRLTTLQQTGKPITDPRNGISRSRIQLIPALANFKPTGFKRSYLNRLQGGGLVSQGVGLATRAGGPAAGNIAIAGIPAGAVVERAYLYWNTYGTPDTSVVLNGNNRTGALIGVAPHTCWLGYGDDINRFYRADVTAQVPGNGVYSISGVGVAPGDAQGASLVVVHRNPASPQMGYVQIMDGAQSVNSINGIMKHAFGVLAVPSTPVISAQWHVGVGDGQLGPSFPEKPLLFRKNAVTPADFLSGSDGPMWDDHTIPIAPALLPAGLTSAPVQIQTGFDCLSWGFSALNYRY
jgi:subtilisin